jgi:hypothetical protein
MSNTAQDYRHILWVPAAVILLGTAAQGAEPSITDAHQPGVTIGMPSGSAPPAGVFFRLAPSYYDYDMVDASGKTSGTHVETTSVTPSLLWSTGWDILGAQTFMLANLPLVDIHARSPLAAKDATGLSNVYLSPLNLSWTLAPGVFVSAGMGVYLPWGNGGVGSDFTTWEQQVVFSYLRDGWNLTLGAYYDVNGENALTHYTTGDRLYLDFTATKTFDGWEIGPVGYVVDQTTGDENTGMAYGPYKPTFGRVQRIALGGLIGTQLGPVSVKAYVTGEVYARNGASGVRSWLSLSLPLWMDGAPQSGPLPTR